MTAILFTRFIFQRMRTVLQEELCQYGFRRYDIQLRAMIGWTCINFSLTRLPITW